MDTAVINIRTEPLVKKKAKMVARDLGLSLSSLIDAYLRQLIRTKTVTFSASREEPTEYMLESLREAEEDIKAGRVSPTFDNAKDAIAWLDNPKRKYANQVRKAV